MEDRLLTALEAFETCPQTEINDEMRLLATDAKERIQGGRRAARSVAMLCAMTEGDVDMGEVGSLTNTCCGLDALPGMGEDFLHALTYPNDEDDNADTIVATDAGSQSQVRTFLLVDAQTGRRFAVPTEPSGGRAFNDQRRWCYRRGRFCQPGEQPDTNFQWNQDLQRAYEEAIRKNEMVES